MLMLFFILLLLTSTSSIERFSNDITLSFDEGPSRNINDVLKILDDYKTKVSFHLNPFRMHDDSNDVEKILNHGHEVGLSIPVFLKGLEDQEVDNIIKIYVDEYKKMSKFYPKIVRLSRNGYDENSKKICEEKYNLIVTKPNIDSEDVEREYIDLLLDEIDYFSYNEPLSICFRDRIDYTVDNLFYILDVINYVGRNIISLTEYYNLKVDFKEKVENEEKVNSESSADDQVSESESIKEDDNLKLDDKNEDDKNEDDKNEEVKIAMVQQNKKIKRSKLIWI